MIFLLICNHVTDFSTSLFLRFQVWISSVTTSKQAATSKANKGMLSKRWTIYKFEWFSHVSVVSPKTIMPLDKVHLQVENVLPQFFCVSQRQSTFQDYLLAPNSVQNYWLLCRSSSHIKTTCIFLLGLDLSSPFDCPNEFLPALWPRTRSEEDKWLGGNQILRLS